MFDTWTNSDTRPMPLTRSLHRALPAFRILLVVPMVACLALPAALAQSSTTNALSRAQAAAILLTLRSSVVPTVTNQHWFADVPEGTPYERYLLAAERLGILSANAKLQLRPNAPTSRASFLKMLAYAFGIPRNMPATYTDVPALSWFAPYAGIAQKYGLFADTSGRQLLRPDQAVSIEEAQTVLQRLIDTDGIAVVPSRLLASTQGNSPQLQLRTALVQLEHSMGIYTLADTPPAEPATDESLHGSAPENPLDKLLSLVNEERLRNHTAPLCSTRHSRSRRSHTPSK